MLKSTKIIYVLAALARLMYGFEGTYSHYLNHFDDPITAISVYISAGVAVVIAIALLIPLSRRLTIFFITIQVVSGVTGTAIMTWFLTQGELNPVTAPVVGGIMFSALLYFKPTLMETELKKSHAEIIKKQFKD